MIKYIFTALAFVSFMGTSASAITIDPGRVALRFDTAGTADDFRVEFGDIIPAGAGFFEYELDLNLEAGTASVFLSNIAGSILVGNRVVDDVVGNISFAWEGITQEVDADGNAFLGLREPTGGGAVASLQSDFFDSGEVQFAISPRGATGGTVFPNVSPDSPLFFFLGANSTSNFCSNDATCLAAWFASDGPIGINGLDFTASGDFHGTAIGFEVGSAEVPEPATMLLLGSGILGGAIRKKRQA